MALRKLGRRDVARLLDEKGIAKAGRKPRTEAKAKAAPVKKAKKSKKAKKTRKIAKAKRTKKARRGKAKRAR